MVVTAESGAQRTYTITVSPLPSPSTTAPSGITSTGAVLGGTSSGETFDALSERGVLVTSVVADGPAERAGLRAGTRDIDIGGQTWRAGGDVIIAVDGQPVTSADELIGFTQLEASVGDNVTFTIVREGQELPLTVVLGERP